VACAALFTSPRHNDPLAIAFLVCAIASWTCGSILSSVGQFYTLHTFLSIYIVGYSADLE
jgi:hypothetical protein